MSESLAPGRPEGHGAWRYGAYGAGVSGSVPDPLERGEDLPAYQHQASGSWRRR